MDFFCGKYQLNLNRPHVMGIINITPDSFSDGGKFSNVDQAVERALQLVAEGADILDIGGESSRPGAIPVSLDDELARVIPVIEALSAVIKVPLSIDTYKPQVMQAAIVAGVDIVNPRLAGARCFADCSEQQCRRVLDAYARHTANHAARPTVSRCGR
jgi:dihydropteroate synthase